MAKLRPLLLPLLLAFLAIIIYNRRIRHEMVDFTTWRQMAARGLHAEPLYRPEDGHYQFKYFPIFAVMMAPFAVLDQETGKMLWFAVSLGLLVALLRWSIAALPERRQSEHILLWVTVVFMAKFYGHELLLGNTNLLLATLLLGGLLAAQIDQPVMAGGLIGAAAFVKPYALLMLPWLAVTQGLAASTMAAGILVTGLILPAAVYGWRGNHDLLVAWYNTVTASTAPNLLGNDNVSLASMWAKWIGPGRAAAALAAVSGASLLGLVAAVWQRRRAVSTPEYLEFSLLMLLIPLLSPQGWDYVLLLGTPAVICLIDRWREVSLPWQVALGLALALMGLTTFDVMGRELYGRFMSWSIVTVAAVIIAAGLAHLRWRQLA